MIEVNNLHKSYITKKKQRLDVLRGLSFTAERGEIFGLIGPNGAGKTTTLRTIATLLKPDKGNISVCGFDVEKDTRKVRNCIGFLTSEMKLTNNLTPKELMYFFGELNHLSKKEINKNIQYLSEYLEIDNFINRPISKLSSGMKQKTALAVSLIHDPDVIIFDEPTNGLDILATKIVVDFLKDCRKKKKTVLLSTHIMSVAEKLCDNIAILLDGSFVEQGSLKSILKKYKTKSLEDIFYSLAIKKGPIKNAS